MMHTTDRQIQLFYDNIPDIPDITKITLCDVCNMKDVIIHISNSGIADCGITRDSELVALYNKGAKGEGRHVVEEAIKQGAYYLNCFDGKLVEYYKSFGFTIYARVAWNDDYAPNNWDYANGKPDIVYMVRIPEEGI